MKTTGQKADAEKHLTTKKIGQILLIDDNEADNEFCEIVINKSQLAEGVKSISNSEEALKYLGHCLYTGDNPDLIILDVMMPRLNGYDLLDKYRGLMTHENYPKKKIKILILSGLYEIMEDPEMDFILKSPEYNDLLIGCRHKPLTIGMLEEIGRQYF